MIILFHPPCHGQEHIPQDQTAQVVLLSIRLDYLNIWYIQLRYLKINSFSCMSQQLF